MWVSLPLTLGLVSSTDAVSGYGLEQQPDPFHTLPVVQAQIQCPFLGLSLLGSFHIGLLRAVMEPSSIRHRMFQISHLHKAGLYLQKWQCTGQLHQCEFHPLGLVILVIYGSDEKKHLPVAQPQCSTALQNGVNRFKLHPECFFVR